MCIRPLIPVRFLIAVEPIVDPFEIIVLAGKRLTSDGHHADRVFVHIFVFQMAEVTIPRQMFREILRRVAELRSHATSASMRRRW
jgi:hypothetical protein